VVQVSQLAWDGHVAHACSLGGGPPALLGGALADRLLVVRGSLLDGGSDARQEVSARHLPLLPTLLLGWASLAACAILPGSPRHALL
jgi:hypothetical protein